MPGGTDFCFQKQNQATPPKKKPKQQQQQQNLPNTGQR